MARVPRPRIPRGNSARSESQEGTEEEKRTQVHQAMETVGASIAGVSSEGFVTSVARERNGHVVARGTGDVVRRDGRGIREGLVELPGE